MDSTATMLLPSASSTISSQVDALFYFLIYASIVFFGIVVSVLIYFSLRYRKKRGEADRKTHGVDHNTKLEIVWSVIPLILVIIVFFWGFKVYMEMSVVPGDAMEVKVTAQKWFWTFTYPEGVTNMNDLIVPVDKPVKLLMSSQDVIHSFFVPQFRIKMDVLPNRYTTTWFEANETGTYGLFCAEYCGEGHSKMLGTVKVVTEREYNEWLEAGSASGEGMPQEEFGETLFKTKACVTCHSTTGETKTGPHLNGLFGHPVALESGKKMAADENYIRQSILDPQAEVVSGFQPVMPTFQGLLKDREVDALIEYIKSLK